MKKLFKPACLLFNILSLILFFFIGLLYAGWIDAGRNQGLAGGAIVLSYGVIFAFVALLFSFFATYRLEHKSVVRGNIILGVLILMSFLWIKFNADERRKERNASQNEKFEPTKPVNQNRVLAHANFSAVSTIETGAGLGLGVFKPKTMGIDPLYFYGNPNLEKSILEHLPSDSIVFRKTEYGSFEISQAPPWLVPLHLKMDYDIFYFKVLSAGKEFLKIEGNRTTGYSTYVNRFDGQLIFWPDFLLKVNSVELLDTTMHSVRIKPLEHASKVTVNFDFMQPILVNENWMKVALMDRDYSKKGEGWIQWKKDERLLISYALLS
jgi:hypothetical protein